MKRNISLLLVITMVMVSLVGCGSDKDVKLHFSEFQSIRGFGELTDEVIEEIKEEDGVVDIIKNKDKSTTLIMEKEGYDKVLANLKEELETLISNTEASEDFNFIEKIDANKDYSKVDILVNKKDLDKFKEDNKDQGGEDILDAFSFSLGSTISVFKAYSDTGDAFEISYIDSETKEEIEKTKFPDFIDKMFEEKQEQK